MYLCSNCGGDFGPQLKQAGYDGADHRGQGGGLDVPHHQGRHGRVRRRAPVEGVHLQPKTLEVLREAFGETKCGAMSIGPAGENLVRLSYINVDERAFGRGGPGAVMGSKKLKGIAVKGTGDIPARGRGPGGGDPQGRRHRPEDRPAPTTRSSARRSTSSR